MSTSALTPLTMTGVSTMSNSLQSILTRAVAIAQVPITQLQNKDSDALQKINLLSGFSTAAKALGNAVTQLGTLSAGQGLTATSSDPTIVSVQNTGVNSAASYTISNIGSVAAAASAQSIPFSSAAGTKVSANGSMELKFGTGPSDVYDFTLTDNSVTGLKNKINSLNAGVTATVLTAGSSNYLSITANNTGLVTDFSLVDDPGSSPHANTQVLSSTYLGSNATFSLNGIPITRTSNYVNDVVPGLNFTLLQKPADNTKTVNLTMATDPNQISNAISSFVTAYNSMVDTVQAQEGRTAGLLSGDYAVRESQQDLQALTSYAGAGTIKSLADMGITFEDASGHLTFNTATFANLSSSQLQGAMAFFGSPSTGFGALAQKFTALTDPVSGVFTLESAGFSQTDKSLQAQIATLTDRANAMQTALQSQLAAADTLIAGLQSQQNILTSSIDSLSYVLYGKPTSSASS